MSNFKDVIGESFANYAGAVLQSRALVDVRDGMKPSARQIFYAMETGGFVHSKPFKKTLKAIGESFRFYIHGDASVEGIVMRAGQPFSFRYPLVEVEGSYGNLMETGNWAAPRYTASRLAAISQSLFTDLKKNTIEDWRDNYDDTEKYPGVLPTKGFYNLVNGTFGIGVGMSSSVPPFNLVELNNAIITLLKNPDATFDEIYCAPDFPTAGTIINGDVIKESLRAGNGKACCIRAKFDYDEKKHTLTVVEMPYNVYTNTICQQLEKIINGEDNPGIKSFNDLTGLNPCIKIYLEKNVSAEVIKNYLYRNTSLQSSYGINLTMLDMGKHPKVFTWKEALQAHIEHQKVVYRRGYEFDLKKIAHDIKIAEGIIKAIQNIEEVIKTIKSAASTREANEALQKLLSIDEEQAKAILDIKLARLARLEVEKYEKDLVNLKAERERITKILENEELFIAEIVKGYEQVAKKYGDARRTEVVNIEIPKDKREKEIAEVIPVDVMIQAYKGHIKRVPISSFKVQRRGGKGVKSENDILMSSFKSNTQDKIFAYSNKGKAYGILCDKIPDSSNTSYNDLFKLDKGEEIIAVSSLKRTESMPKYCIFVTAEGVVKKSHLAEVTSNRTSGTKVINLAEGDNLVNIIFMDEEELILVSKNGQSIRFATKGINPIGKAARGIKGMKLKEDDKVVSALPIHKTTDYLAIVGIDGQGKKVTLDNFPLQSTNGVGTKCHTSEIAGAAMVSDEDNILLVGNKTIAISAKDIPALNKTAGGNILSKGNVKKIVKF